jgi:hypothetical protein
MAEKKPMTPSIIVGPGRLSFCSIFEPKESQDGGKPRWETVLLLPPAVDVQPYLAALEAACVAEFGPRASWPRNLRKPEDVIMPATEKGKYSGYEEGWNALSCGNSKDAPEVVDAMREAVTDPKQAYPGRWARLSVRPYAFKNKKAGVSLWLTHVQLLRNDTPLAGGPKAKDVFDEVAQEMDDIPF